MADPTLPQSVVDFLATLTDTTKVQAFFDEIQKRIPIAGTAFNTLTTAVKKVGDQVKDTTEGFKAFANISFGTLENFMGGFLTKMSSATAQAGLLTSSMMGLLPASAGFEALGGGADIATQSIKNTNEAMAQIEKASKFIPGFGLAISESFKLLNQFQNIAAPAKEFENGMLAIAGTSGTMGALMANVGEDFSKMNQEAEKFSSITKDVGNSAGVSSNIVAGYAKQLMTIPGAMDLSVEGLNRNTGGMHMLDAAMKVATGTGQSFGNTFKKLNDVYLQFNTTGQKALEYVTRLSSVSNNLVIPLNLVENTIFETSRNLRYFGDNTQSTMNILEKFGGSLKNLGLGGEAISDLSKGFINSISGMNIAQESFLSAQTGGPGGLMGGLQIELLKSQNKMDEAAKKVEESLRKQFGGRIVTLEEGAHDSKAAAQYVKQVQLLTTGPTKVARDAGEAKAMIDAMSKGQIFTPNKTQSPEGSYLEAINRGNKFQERQYDPAILMLNQMKRMTDLSAISAYNLTQLVAGSKGAHMGEYIRGVREESQKFAMENSSAKNMPRREGETMENVFKNGGDKLREKAAAIGGFFNAMVGDSKDQIQKLFTNVNSEAENNKNAKNQTNKIIGTRVLGQRPGLANSIAQSEPRREIAEGRAVPVNVSVHAVCERCTRNIAKEEAHNISNRNINHFKQGQQSATTTGTSGEPLSLAPLTP